MKNTEEIILDEQNLTKRIRKEVIEDIKQNGMASDDLVQVLSRIESVDYFTDIFKKSLTEILKKYDKDSKFHYDTIKSVKKLKLCKEILEM